MISIEEEESDNSGGKDTKSEAKHYQMEILSYDIHLKKYCKWVIIIRGEIGTN